MDKEESPLDVLSRAATMVSPPSYGKFLPIFLYQLNFSSDCVRLCKIIAENICSRLLSPQP